MATGSPVVGAHETMPRRRTAATVATLATTAVVAVLATYTFSFLTGALSDSVVKPVGTATLALAVLLCVWAPRRYGVVWARTGEHVAAVGLSVLAVALVVAVFRLTGSTAPYDATLGEFVLVPVGEEMLFRGFLLTTVLEVLRRHQVGPHAAAWAVCISAAAFGVGHLGNLGTVETAFVVLQVFVASVFGVVAGWLRVRTESLVGPVLMHATMNIVAVA